MHNCMCVSQFSPPVGRTPRGSWRVASGCKWMGSKLVVLKLLCCVLKKRLLDRQFQRKEIPREKKLLHMTFIPEFIIVPQSTSLKQECATNEPHNILETHLMHVEALNSLVLLCWQLFSKVQSALHSNFLSKETDLQILEASVYSSCCFVWSKIDCFFVTHLWYFICFESCLHSDCIVSLVQNDWWEQDGNNKKSWWQKCLWKHNLSHKCSFLYIVKVSISFNCQSSRSPLGVGPVLGDSLDDNKAWLKIIQSCVSNGKWGHKRIKDNCKLHFLS